jgi:hypothetical protein
LSIKHVDVLESRSAWASITTSLLHLTMIGTNKHGVGCEISRNNFHYMMHQHPTSLSLLKLGPCLFFDSSGCGLVTEMECATCHPCFFGHSQVTWLGFPQYK